MTLVMNPWGGVFRAYDENALDVAGQGEGIELLVSVTGPAPGVDQRKVADADRYELCGESALAAALQATGRRGDPEGITQALRARWGEAGVARGTNASQLAQLLAGYGVPYAVRVGDVGDMCDAAAAAGHVVLIAVGTHYVTPDDLEPGPGDHIGHWMLGGALGAAAAPTPPQEAPTVTTQEAAAILNLAYRIRQIEQKLGLTGPTADVFDAQGFATQVNAWAAGTDLHTLVNNIDTLAAGGGGADPTAAAPAPATPEPDTSASSTTPAESAPVSAAPVPGPAAAPAETDASSSSPDSAPTDDAGAELAAAASDEADAAAHLEQAAADVERGPAQG